MATKDTNIETELIIGLRNENHGSFEALFALYSKPLYQFSLSYLKSKEEAEGIVQEVFFKIWKNRKQLKTDTSFQSYLFTIALNGIRKRFNKLSKMNEVKHDILYRFSNNKSHFDDFDDYQFLLDKLDDFIGQMPEKRRQVFIKKKIEGKSLKEIAGELEISSKTVEYHITEAMKFLKQKFEKLQVKGMVFFFLFIQEEKN